MKKSKILLEDKEYSELFKEVMKSIEGLANYLESHEQEKEKLWELYESGEIDSSERDAEEEILTNEFAGITADHIREIRKTSKAAGKYALETLGENPDFETAEKNLKGDFSFNRMPEESIDYDVFKRVLGSYVKSDDTIMMVVPGRIFIYPNLESVEAGLKEIGYSEVKDKAISDYLLFLIETYSDLSPLSEQAKFLVVQTYVEEKNEKAKNNSTGQPGEV